MALSRVSFTSVLALIASWAHIEPTHAADIATVLGPADPADPTFATECPNGNVPVAGSDAIPECPFTGTLLEATCLHRVDIDTSATGYPHAVCGDGTAASFYVRPYGDPDDANRWVIHLQGGGGCTDETTCRERWCGDDGFYTAAMMSNDWNADGIVDRPTQAWLLGISAFVSNNDFASWNHVYVPYCSSDLWMGRDSDVPLGSFSIAANGHTIIHAVRNMLRKRGPSWTPLGVFPYAVPDLDAAEEILFTGTSAGGYGVLQNGEWFIETFPLARSGLVIDAIMDVGPLVISDYDLWDATSAQPWGDRRLELWEEMWAPGGYWDEIDAFIDESCRADFDLHECMSPSKVLRTSFAGTPLIETPTFLRMDLEDPVLASWVVGPNPDGDVVTLGNGGPQPTLQDYTEMMRETMVRLAADSQTEISVHAPRCGQHVGLEHGNAFANWTTDDTSDTLPRTAAGIDETFRDALWLWFNPGGAFVRERRIDSDEVDLVTGLPIDYSSCP